MELEEEEKNKSLVMRNESHCFALFRHVQVYLYLSLGYIQMLKAFTPVITMIFLFVFR